jgi:hypothetical protein
MRIETEYHAKIHYVSVRYDRTIQRLFTKTSTTVTEVFDAEVYAEKCRELGESSPLDLACGAELLRRLGTSRSVSASGDDFGWGLSLVAWTILHLTDSKRSPGTLPVALTALAYIAPIRLPDQLELPDPASVLDKESISPEGWQAYEDIRHEGRKVGSVPS